MHRSHTHTPLRCAGAAKLPVTCPHCSKDHTIDAVAQAEHDRKITAAKAELDTTKAALTEAQKAVPAVAELATVKAELTKIKTAGERATAFDAAGVQTPARAVFELLYSAHAEDVEEGSTPPTFAEWLASDAVKTHPVLAPHLGKPAAAGAPQPKPKGTTQATTAAASTETGAKRADAAVGPTTPDEVRAYFRSAEYRALDGKAQAAKRAELQTAVDARGKTAP